MPRLLVTGCGRSGTAYTARVLQLHGLDIGHEQVGNDGTVDWHAASRLDDFADYVVVHQVRHPLRAIASITTLSAASWRFVARHTAALANAALLRRAASHWFMWNRLIEQRGYPIRRVEQLGNWLGELLAPFNIVPDVSKLMQVPITLNTRSGHYTKITWASLEALDRKLCARIYDKARQYGYTPWADTEGSNV